ncbi:hypothetical protein O7626_18845 [Micromonospora sp. WMMD1102]|uniref:hypothetical protein n=1 Tax=Micromonospora sp. WMMD1102 TaxID=3016105 RepID=UPI00241572CD|nr:hypothetical protein [Micromonospora sp. WMMD1102]MDG4787972.1 hypothetical protein [Micromonospora sp. WMMD1102]
MTKLPTVPGYLRPGQPQGGRTPLALLVPCRPCGVWHRHGAGTMDGPYYKPGDLTHRVAHCPRPVDSYEWVRVQAEPFDPRWMRNRRRAFSVITEAYPWPA